MNFEPHHLLEAKTRGDLIAIAKKNKIPIAKTLKKISYEEELARLQAEMVNLQNWIVQQKLRVAVLFEGRDASGKGGSIKRFKEHLNPRTSKVVALTKPTDVEQGQWYFRRYIKVLPNAGEIAFFDRSWYNRAVVEPVMGFCSKEQYKKFIVQVPEYEHLLYEDNLKLIKFWFSISKNEQKKRFKDRLNNPLKRWKYSPVDMRGQELWDSYTHHKEEMFSKTHTNFSPWVIVKANDKKQARLESMRYVLSQFDYKNKGESKVSLLPDPNIVMRYHRSIVQIDK
ncbi:polyphosphate kinase 2 [Kriegella aquimaris]|uniref:ADP/GDP-polyphosphate phosphotransferase n=1 Tax=Kriegella aquimaris TaxID=192904 RepID=A0A1G9SXG7_9FLAO|nr:polyphosphate kinase 2 [Kriegella aquimaris]SDM40131.1 polyphosphate kinase 2, PA0141 family [Kriegella aquimaris]